MPNRASAPSTPTPTRPRGALSREVVVQAAIEQADRAGLDAVSIRRVAAALGVRPMSLYTYIASKEALLDLMADAVVAREIAPATLPEGWREALRAVARRSHAAFTAHSWLVELAGRRPHLGNAALLDPEQLLGAIAPLRLTPGAAWTVLFSVSDYTLGHATRVLSSGDDGADPGGGTFEDGLEILLDGIARRFTW